MPKKKKKKLKNLDVKTYVDTKQRKFGHLLLKSATNLKTFKRGGKKTLKNQKIQSLQIKKKNCDYTFERYKRKIPSKE